MVYEIDYEEIMTTRTVSATLEGNTVKSDVNFGKLMQHLIKQMKYQIICFKYVLGIYQHLRRGCHNMPLYGYILHILRILTFFE